MSCFRAVMDTIWPESRGYGHCRIAEIIVSGSMERAHSSRVETDAPSEGSETGAGVGDRSRKQQEEAGAKNVDSSHFLTTKTQRHKVILTTFRTLCLGVFVA